MSFTGFKTTRKGRALIAKVLAEKQLTISRVAAGAGVCENESDIDDMEDLIDFRVLGTSTEPKYDVETMTMTVEFRRDLHEGELEGFWLSEFGIFAIDPDEGEILMYYYSFGDEPQHLNGTSSKTANVLRYPVSVTIGEDMEVISLGYPAGAFLMPKDLSDHDGDPDAHKELVAKIVEQVEGTGNSVKIAPSIPNDMASNSWVLRTSSWPSDTPEEEEEDPPEPEPAPEPEPEPELETPEVVDPNGKEVVAFDLVNEEMPLNVVINGVQQGISNAEEVISADDVPTFKINRN